MPTPIKIPIPTLERLAGYLRMLIDLEAEQVVTVSSADAERLTGVGAPQFRKDLSYFGEFGKPGVGYDVASLHRTIARILKIDKPRPVLLIGAGNLGTALAGYPGFSDHNFSIAGVFDHDPDKIGGKLWDHVIQPISAMEEANQRIGARIAILAVPGPAVQEVADLCLAAGIREMLNFTPAVIRHPAQVFVRNVSFVQELAVLAYHIDERE